HDAIAMTRCASARISTAPATWSNGSSIRSNNVDGSQHATTSSPSTILLSSNWHRYGCGCALMSARPSKIHAVVDTNGLPVRLALTAGEAHDNRLADKLLSRLKSGSMLLADRGYDADWIRALAARKGALANIPPRCNRTEPICFSLYLYRARNF